MVSLTAQALKSKLPTHQLVIPQARPLSKGEILGCTAPTVEGVGKVLYVGDGRFHLEAMMIANPHAEAYRWSPRVCFLQR